MNILEIYEKYKILPSLAEHQLRVAAVAMQLCQAISTKVDDESIVKACLLHDMGNLLKFDFAQFPHFFEPQGAAYWQRVKEEIIKTYGTTDEHQATLKIAAEIGVSKQVLSYIDCIGFTHATDNLNRPVDFKICNYADMRVGPVGVLSLDERMADGAKRYKNRLAAEVIGDARLVEAIHRIEDDIFKISKIKPQDITDESIGPIIEQLKSYKI